MKIHEYQAKQLFAQYAVPIPKGEVASTPAEARAVAEKLDCKVVVKAQVHVGGRGKAGGIKLAENAAQAEEAASQILGMNLKGLTVEKVLVEEAADIQAEYYLGITVDHARRRDVVMVSSVGGVDIEEVAVTAPDKIAKLHLDPAVGLLDFHVRRLAYEAGLPPETHRACGKFLHALYRCYQEIDASLAEINPLVFTGSGDLLATDAKINIDDSALFRQRKLAELREDQEDDPIEAEAHKRGVTYVRLDGDIGIIGNGAGLVMTTLDVVQREGGRPANFLDVGGGATAAQVELSIDTVLLDKNVKGIVINIFGGITRCDEVAKGIIGAVDSLDLAVPLVVRLTGTREEEGKALLAETALVPADSMQDAAQKIVALVGS